MLNKFRLLRMGMAMLAIATVGFVVAQPVGPTVGLAPDTGLPTAFLEAWPILGLLLGTGAVLLAAEIVKSAVQWLKARLQKQMLDVPHPLIHLLNSVLSAAVGWIFIAEGRLDADPVFGSIGWPLNWLIFTLAVFWRAGGKKDEEIEATNQLARVRR